LKSFDFYYITNGGNILKDAEAAIEAGASIVQYREKHKSTREMMDEAARLKRLCSGRAELVVNDRMDIALAIGADGIHLGQKDMPISLARSHFKGIIGVSVHDDKEAIEAEKAGAGYVGLGPIFATFTKKDAESPVGLDMIRKTRKSIRIPIVAIGGITLTNAREVILAGAVSVASISALQPDVKANVQEFRRLINEAKGLR
jgi:thiamine-phosphate pyrophosphorylase